MNYQFLNPGEKTRLVEIIQDSIKETTEFDDFQETIGQLAKGIPGLEGSVAKFVRLSDNCQF